MINPTINMSIKDTKMYERCVNKTVELDKNHLFNLIKIIMYLHPETMKTIDDY